MLCPRAKPSDFNFFCKGPERKYIRLYRSYGLCPNRLAFFTVLPCLNSIIKEEKQSQTILTGCVWLCSNKTSLNFEFCIIFMYKKIYYYGEFFYFIF